MVWRKGTLFAGEVDIQRALFNLHRKMVPTEVLREKADMYVDAGLVSRARADVMLRVIEAERDWSRMINDVAPDQDDDAAGTGRLNHAQLRPRGEAQERFHGRRDGSMASLQIHYRPPAAVRQAPPPRRAGLRRRGLVL